MYQNHNTTSDWLFLQFLLVIKYTFSAIWKYDIYIRKKEFFVPFHQECIWNMNEHWMKGIYFSLCSI